MFAAYLHIVVKPITDRYNDKAKKYTLSIDEIHNVNLSKSGCSDAVADVIDHLAMDREVIFTSATLVVGKEQVDLSIVTTKPE